MRTKPTTYWQTHYCFGGESKKNEKNISDNSIEVIIINTIAPMLFAYGKYKQNNELCQMAYNLLENIKPENNNIVRMWEKCGLKAANAADTQALIQLKKQYCDKKDCLRCRIGYEYLKTKHW